MPIGRFQKQQQLRSIRKLEPITTGTAKQQWPSSVVVDGWQRRS